MENKEVRVGVKLSHVAKAKGISQQKIADHCQISRISVHRFFKGQTELKATDFMNLLSTLGISIDYKINEALENSLGYKSKPPLELNVIATQAP
ncbi:MAG: helix-turn-helix transcriptional regulator [Bdellovibrionaceae bacterium]|jgi:transcriptional regulator with XRE-family HTH domain|nr:helix-turn-helix transcriptional regulator [Pseudobdellovibrionaceae bacterium]